MNSGFARMQPLARRFDAKLREYPSLAKAVDAVGETWRKLIEAFCEVIDPQLARFFPDVRLVADTTASGEIVLHRITKGETAHLGGLAELSEATRHELTQVKWSGIELRLRPEKVLRRTLSLPTASRDYLASIIEHRLDRLTPWRPEKVLYGYRVAEMAEDPNTVSVSLLATSKDSVDEPVRRMREAGFAPTAIGASEGPLQEPLPINLQSDGGALRRMDSRKMVSRVALAVIAVSITCVVVTGSIASSASDERDATAAKLLKARRLLKSATLANAGTQEQAMLAAKAPDKSAIVLIDKLAKAIPEDTYLKEMTIAADKVRLVGLSANAPALVGRLEASGLVNVRFTAAIQREKDGRDTFEITAKRPGAPEGSD